MDKGEFIVMKTGAHPMRTKLRLFLDWGIRFEAPYEVPEKSQRPVDYASKIELERNILLDAHATLCDEEGTPPGTGGDQRILAAQERRDTGHPIRF